MFTERNQDDVEKQMELISQAYLLTVSESKDAAIAHQFKVIE